jgi:hypothetical protein
MKLRAKPTAGDRARSYARFKRADQAPSAAFVAPPVRRGFAPPNYPWRAPEPKGDPGRRRRKALS